MEHCGHLETLISPRAMPLLLRPFLALLIFRFGSAPMSVVYSIWY